MRIAFLVITLLVLLDQAAKIWIRQHIDLYHVVPILPNFLELTLVQNKGVSFSFMADWPESIRLPLLLSISVIAVLGMLYYLIWYWKRNDLFMKTAFVMIIPGAIGNLIDRALFGSVTDFLHFRWYEFSFFVNNLADCFISVGVCFFILSTVIGKSRKPSDLNPSSETSTSSHKP